MSMSASKFGGKEGASNAPPAVLAGLSVHGSLRPRGVADLLRCVVLQRRSIAERELIDWCQKTLSAVSPELGNATPLVEAILNALIAAGDIGRGQCFGENVVIAVEPFSLEVPGVGFVLLGDWASEAAPEATSGRIVRIERSVSPDTRARAFSLEQYLGVASQDVVAHLERKCGTTVNTDVLQLFRIGSLFGTLNESTGALSIDSNFQPILRDWAGLSLEAASENESSAPTAAQAMVASRAAYDRLVVEAGPGTGKTFTACNRVSHLLSSEEIEPERLLVLSFTRVAVAELRDRISGSLPSPHTASRIRIATFDSFAAKMIGMASQATKFKGHDSNIRLASKLLRTNNAVRDFVYDLDHVLIDEAQDLVGDRREFCEELINQIHEDCGVTVLGDSAQAIYGYSQGKKASKTLLEQLLEDEDFDKDELIEDRRTRSEELANFFKTAREELRAKSSDRDRVWTSMKSLIEAAAVETDIADVVMRTDLSDNTILVRSRAEVHTLAARFRDAGKPCRIRLSGRPERVDPWIAAAIGDMPAAFRVNKADIQANLERVVEGVPEDILDRIWKTVQELAGEFGERVSVGEVANELEAGPPLDLLKDHEGAAGPLLSTIHSWKGREAARVSLVLPRSLGANFDPSEEARILFVGATRAAEELRTIRSFAPLRFQPFPLGDERRWRATSEFQEFEIGLDGDVGRLDAVESPPPHRERTKALWKAATENAKAIAIRNGRTWNVFIEGEAGSGRRPVLGILSDFFTSTLLELPGVSSLDDLPEVLTGFRITGASTSVTRKAIDGSRQVSLRPLLGGLARLNRSKPQDGR